MIGSATHGATPPDSSGGTPVPGPGSLLAFEQLRDAVGLIGQALADALLPVVERLTSAFALFGEQVVATFGSLANLLRACWDVDACIDYAVAEMGVTRADVRAVVLFGHRRCPEAHVWLWNHRRLPFPPGSGPALAWAL